MITKNAAQLALSFRQTGAGRVSCVPIMARIRFLPNARSETSRIAPNSQYSTVGFHLMKVSS